MLPAGTLGPPKAELIRNSCKNASTVAERKTTKFIMRRGLLALHLRLLLDPSGATERDKEERR